MSTFYSLLIISLWIISCIILAVYCRKIFPDQRELSRKIIHIGTGPIIPLAWWLEVPSNVAIIASTIVTCSLIINYIFNFVPAIEDIQRQSYGTIAYATSITLLLILFWRGHPSAVTAAVLIMAFGDGLAGLLGRQIISPSWEILKQRKSFIGTLTMAVVAITILLFLSSIIGFPVSIVNIGIVALIAVLLEQISIWGIDNLTVPIGVAFAWIWIIEI